MTPPTIRVTLSPFSQDDPTLYESFCAVEEILDALIALHKSHPSVKIWTDSSPVGVVLATALLRRKIPVSLGGVE